MTDVFTIVEFLSQSAFRAVIFLTGEQTLIQQYSQLCTCHKYSAMEGLLAQLSVDSA